MEEFTLDSGCFDETLLDKLDHVSLLIEYIATCGIRQKDLLDYLAKIDGPILPALQPEILKKNKLFPEITSRYPPVDKPSFAFPSELQSFCFPIGYEVREGDQNFAVSSSFVLTNETGRKTYVSYFFLYCSLLTIYEQLEGLLKGGENTLKLRDTEERETYLRCRSNTALVNTKLNNSTSIFGCSDRLTTSSQTSKPSIVSSKRHRVLIPSCLCIISQHPFFQTFDSILREIYGAYSEFLEYPLEYYVSSVVCRVPVPPRGFVSVKLQLGANFQDIEIRQPLMNQLPLLDTNFSLLTKHFSAENVIKILNAILLEHHVLFISSELENFTPISESILALMFPFEHQLVYIPMLPEAMIEFLSTPVPIIAGAHRKMLEPALESVVVNTCVADIDNNTVEFKGEENGSYVGKKNCEDLAELPNHETGKLLARIAEPW
eukprot:TRINITY_DN10525_c0_g3_i2.p1 TRINITY_DN10525_c0_g3~~TRINITY_DN10525_c0_g3_i2.p1  ORF type:complete len:434 (-),score=110.77 TRINITY_DN10525_c0_g3_i2:1864-3165(-)